MKKGNVASAGGRRCAALEGGLAKSPPDRPQARLADRRLATIADGLRRLSPLWSPGIRCIAGGRRVRPPRFRGSGRPAVVDVVVVAHGHLADKGRHGVLLDVVLVVGVRVEGQGLAFAEFDVLAGGHVVAAAVTAHEHRGVETLLGLRISVVQVEDSGAAAAHDDILHLVPVEMHRGDLSGHAHHDLLGVYLGVLRVLHVAVAQGDERQPLVFEVAFAVVGDVPAEHVVADLVPLMVFVGPFLRGKGQVGRDAEPVLIKQGLELLDGGVDFGALHGVLPCLNCCVRLFSLWGYRPAFRRQAISVSTNHPSISKFFVLVLKSFALLVDKVITQGYDSCQRRNERNRNENVLIIDK